MLKILCLILSIFPCFCHSYQYQLSICAIFQNESPYLKEWIDYHESKGVEHFYLYNNNSTDNFHDILNPYIDLGLVELIEWPSQQEENDWAHFSFVIQPGAYNDAIARSRGKSKWLALIDTDEFIVPVTYDNIVQLLEENFSNISGLCVNWQCYGTSHIQKFPEGKMLENLTMKMKWNHEWNKTGKTIVQPLHITYCDHPHFCQYTPGHWGVDVLRRTCQGNTPSVEIDLIRINHYWTRDEDFFWNKKIARYKKWGVTTDGALKHASEMNEEFDPILSSNSRGRNQSICWACCGSI